MTKPLDVVIVGAGFAGLASAVLLARQGHTVTVLEKFAEPRAVGAGVLIQPTGLAAMRALGIDEEIHQHGARVTHLWGVNHRQRPIVNLRYDTWRPGSYGLGLHRGVLFEALWRAAAEAGVTVKTGQDVRDLAALEAAHDLVVIANGAASGLRAQTGLPCRDRVYPWGAVWALLEDPQQTAGHTLWQWYRGAGQMLGIMPTGRAPARDPGRDVPVVSLFWSLDAGRHAEWQDRGLSAWKNELLALNPSCAALLEQVTDIGQLTWARYHDVVMPRYHTRLCVVIGDAAHATSPQLGQGTNMALLDALALARSMAVAKDASAVPAALAHYTELRRKHLHFYSQASRLLTPVFQSDHRLLPWLRDVFMGPTAGWPVLRGAHCETLVGVRNNWWGWKALEPASLDAGMDCGSRPQ